MFLLTDKAAGVSTGCYPRIPFRFSQRFFDRSRARFRRFPNSPFGLKQLEPLLFRFGQDSWARNTL